MHKYFSFVLGVKCFIHLVRESNGKCKNKLAQWQYLNMKNCSKKIIMSLSCYAGKNPSCADDMKNPLAGGGIETK